MSTTGTDNLRPPKQRRSRDTLRRILDAARDLLAANDHEEVTLRGIAQAAAVSQSSLFARFRTKEALLDHLHEEMCRDRQEIAARGLAELEVRATGVSDMVHGMMRIFVQHLRNDGNLVLSLSRAGNQIPTIKKRENGLRRSIAEQARDAVLGRLPGDWREQAGQLIDSQISLVMTSTPQLMSDGGGTLLDPDLSDDELAAKLADLALHAGRALVQSADGESSG